MILKRLLFGSIILGCICLTVMADPDSLVMPMPDARALFQSAAAINSQNPVSLLVNVVKTTTYPDGTPSASGASGSLISNPVQTVSNLLTGDGTNNIGLGLSVHF